jgi:hypothetical protein
MHPNAEYIHSLQIGIYKNAAAAPGFSSRAKPPSQRITESFDLISGSLHRPPEVLLRQSC